MPLNVSFLQVLNEADPGLPLHTHTKKMLLIQMVGNFFHLYESFNVFESMRIFRQQKKEKKKKRIQSLMSNCVHNTDFIFVF